MERLLQDLRYAIRTFVRQPLFTLTAILALALGIGANTAVFSVVSAVLLKPLPYPDPSRLIYAHDTYPAVTYASVSAAKYLALREGTRSLEALGAHAPASLTLTGDGDPEQVSGARVSADLFQALDVPALIGRPFSADEDVPNAEPVIVLSHGLWQRRFGSDRTVVNTVITVDGVPRRIAGVMPPGFAYPGRSEAWIPLALDPAVAPGGNFLRLVGRMRPGTPVEQVQQELSALSSAYNSLYGTQRDVRVWPLHEILVQTNRRVLLVLQGAVAFVLLVACANVANLLLARSVTRARELAIRSALGAGRGRLVRQLLTESVLLSLAGAAVGVLLGSWLVRLFVALAPASFPMREGIGIDPYVLGFTLALATLTGLVFGLAPAIRGFRTAPRAAQQDMATRGSTGARGASRTLVVAEVALALVLVVGAGVMGKSLLKLQQEDPGFSPAGVMTFVLNLPEARYPDAAPVPLVARVLDHIRAVPGVRAAGAISHLPLAESGFNGPFSIEGREPFAAGTAPITEYRVVSPGYFTAMGVPIHRGRDFAAADSASNLPVVIINQAMADRYWPGEDPVGARVQLAADPGSVVREVVGVAGSVRSARLSMAPDSEVYVPHEQYPVNGMGIVVRAGAAPESAMPAIRQRIAAADPDLPLVRVQTMDDIVEASTGGARLSSVLTAMFALVAALLAGLGIYSLIAYSVAQRTREIGIRMALGADRRAVARLVVGEGLGLAAIGLAAGQAGAMFLTQTIETLLYEVSPTDPAVLGATCAGVLALAALASLVPAVRALRVDPASALRAE